MLCAVGYGLVLPETQTLLENLLVQYAAFVCAKAQVVDLPMLVEVTT